MSNDFSIIKSITQLHESLGYPKPKHPSISIVDISSWNKSKAKIDSSELSIDLFNIALKDKRCGNHYGRRPFDFDEGVMVFTEPNEKIFIKDNNLPENTEGWMLTFHSDLIRNTSLNDKIDNYKFFFYSSKEALHLSSSEENIVISCINLILNEVNERIDNHSQTVMVSTLELLLNLCTRFYERQFNTRAIENSSIVKQINLLLKEYYQSGFLTKKGVPNVDFFAEKVNLSPNYLNDLLKKETGKTTKEYIHNFIVDKAKILLTDEGSIEELAHRLGFKLPSYFIKLFKLNTGMTPEEYKFLH